jgi:uncharacterized protein YoxC
MQHIKNVNLVILVLVVALTSSFFAIGQTSSESTNKQPTADARSQVSQDVKSLATQMDQLMEETSTVKKRLDEGYKTLDQTAKDLDGAEQFVSDKIATLRTLADRIKPGSPFIKLFEHVEGLLQKRAREAESSSDPARHSFGDPLNEKASQIASVRSKFQDMYSGFSKEIDHLERQKAVIEDLYLLHKSQQFIDEARKEYDIYQGLFNKMTTTNKELYIIVSPYIPTQ